MKKLFLSALYLTLPESGKNTFEMVHPPAFSFLLPHSQYIAGFSIEKAITGNPKPGIPGFLDARISFFGLINSELICGRIFFMVTEAPLSLKRENYSFL